MHTAPEADALSTELRGLGADSIAARPRPVRHRFEAVAWKADTVAEDGVPTPKSPPRPATDPARLARHRRVSAALGALDEEGIVELLGTGTRLGVGIGGSHATVSVDGVPVVVKRVALTDREQLPAMSGTTSNLFGLAPSWHYGVGSPGFGVWREVAANELATAAMAAGHLSGVALLHHTRVLPGAPPPGGELAPT